MLCLWQPHLLIEGRPKSGELDGLFVHLRIWGIAWWHLLLPTPTPWHRGNAAHKKGVNRGDPAMEKSDQT
jgi:hypothetical protein